MPTTTDIFLKLDDDVLLSVADVHRTLLKHLYNGKWEHPDSAFAGWCFSGAPVIRNLEHKWGVSRKVYSPPTYPRYCLGLSYALTRSTIPLLLNQTHNTPLIHLEDVSFGILAQKAGNIRLIDIPKWRVDLNWINDILIDYRKYQVIHTGEGRIDKVENLWRDSCKLVKTDTNSKPIKHNNINIRAKHFKLSVSSVELAFNSYLCVWTYFLVMCLVVNIRNCKTTHRWNSRKVSTHECCKHSWNRTWHVTWWPFCT